MSSLSLSRNKDRFPMDEKGIVSLCINWIAGVMPWIYTHAISDPQPTASGERSGSKDDARRENDAVCAEIDNLSREHKKLRQIVEQLNRDYEESKAYDPLRRYEKLKGMVKRTILHLRLNPDDPNTVQSAGIGGLVQGCRDFNHQAESARRREEKYSKMTRHDLLQENVVLQEQVRELRRKCAIIRDLIDNLHKCYESCKRLSVMTRYTMLKAMVKKVIHDELIQ